LEPKERVDGEKRKRRRRRRRRRRMMAVSLMSNAVKNVVPSEEISSGAL